MERPLVGWIGLAFTSKVCTNNYHKFIKTNKTKTKQYIVVSIIKKLHCVETYIVHSLPDQFNLFFCHRPHLIN